MGILFNLFKRANGSEQNSSENTQKNEQLSDEKIEEIRKLEDEMVEKMRNPEVEANVQTALRAVDCLLNDFENKVIYISRWIITSKSLKKSALRNLFVKGAQTGAPEFSLKNSFRIPKAADYYYDNFYSDEKQLEIFNKSEEIKNTYNKMMDEIK